MQTFPFSRVVIVNRGEPAVRLIRAVRELNEELGVELKTIALYTEPDAASIFVNEADEAYLLGPSTYYDQTDGRTKSTYLNYEKLTTAIKKTNADAAWVGWGFVAEHAEFADLCERLGVVFIGPPGNVMRRLGDKISAKVVAEECLVPVSPWSNGALTSLQDAEQHAKRLGFPLMLKASAGGGGRGIRKISHMNELAEAFEGARTEAAKSFGDDSVFLEKMIPGARHIEVQVIADRAGTTWALGVRDCSIQRRNQKIIEEAPSPALSAEQEKNVKLAAIRLAQTVEYLNAGTVEFLYTPQTRAFYFMEMNTRLQVEHPVTELTTGVDIVKLQLKIAAGHLLAGEPPATVGHAIEVRLNAEDPDNRFAPSPGKILVFRPPAGPGLRIDSGFMQGDVIAPDFDSMIAKIIAVGQSREEALARLRRGLLESTIIIEGGTSNKAFLLELLRHPEIERSEVDIGWLDRLREQPTPPKEFANIALLQAAILSYEEEREDERQEMLTSASRGRSSVRTQIGVELELRLGPSTYKFLIRQQAPKVYQVTVDGVNLQVHLQQMNQNEVRLSCGRAKHRVVSVPQGREILLEVDSIAHRIKRDDGGTVRAASPAIVLSTRVKEGERVSHGQVLVVLEAMKTEMLVLSPSEGRVRQLLVNANERVSAGSALLILEEAQRSASSGEGSRVDFAPLINERTPNTPKDLCIDALERMRCFLLGFDIELAEVRQAIQTFELNSKLCEPGSQEILEREESLLAIFSDLLLVYSRSYIIDQKISPAECMHRFLQSVDKAGKDLPEVFLDRLLGLLSHYGLNNYNRSQEFEEALLWSQKAESRSELLSEPVVSALERRLSNVDELAPHIPAHFCGLLDRLIEAAYPNHPTIHDLAKQTRFVYFDKPILDAAQNQEANLVREEILLLAQNPQHPSRKEFISHLARSPQPIMGLFAPLTHHENLGTLSLEILIRRFYRDTQLSDLKMLSSSEGSILITEYEQEHRRLPLFALLTRIEELERGLSLLCWHINKLPPQQDVRIDCYLQMDAPTRINFYNLLQSTDLISRVGRICFSFIPTSRVRAEYHTFALDGISAKELVEYQGVHPMWAGRLELWRLRDFNTERLSAPEDIYLYRATAKNNPKDERLFAFIDVRDLTPLNSHSSVPCLENLFMEALSYMRGYLYRLPPESRLLWNRIIIHLGPELDLDLALLRQLVELLAKETQNLGIEKIVIRAKSRAKNLGSVENLRIQDTKPLPETTFGSPSSPELWGVSAVGMQAVSANVVAAALQKATWLFRARKEVCGEVTALWLIGPLNQTTNFKRIADGLEGNVVLVVEEVSEISETGIERLAALQNNTDASFYIARASVALLSGIAASSNRFKGFKIVSVMLPANCRFCGLWLSLEANFSRIEGSIDGTIPSSFCPRCGTQDSHSCEPQLISLARSLVRHDIPTEIVEYMKARPTREDLQPSNPSYELDKSPLKDYALHFTLNLGQVVRFRLGKPSTHPVRPLNAYAQKVIQLRSRGLVYPYEIIRLITAPLAQQAVKFPPGEFMEYDFDENNQLVPVHRAFGENNANLVVGVIKSFTRKHPEGMMRVLILGDASRDMGALAEPECRRIIAAIELAEFSKIPIDWFPVSSGAKIAMDSGTENLDWTAAVLRRIIEFTQRGGLMNIIVLGINVGAQSYWNAEAAMLMHTKGILVMTPEASMVLTGKKALEYSGSVAAADHPGIGGIEAIMGPNGEAQYIATNTSEALKILYQFYEHAYVAPGERFPRRANTTDPLDRDISLFPYQGEEFGKLGEIFSDLHNPSRKKAFSIRAVMQGVIDQDIHPLERWSMMREAEMAVIWDAHIGGLPLSLIGIESRPISRGGGHIPGDGPDTFSGGTLFPLSSKKVARALNAASGVRPVVILANLSGFDGSPESMRKLQLEYGAEIGRAVVNFRGPLLLIVISRYHGGAYVVFSKALNRSLEVSALRGSYASVIGGAPAAAVVLTREVNRRVYLDPRVIEFQRTHADEGQRAKYAVRYNALLKEVQREKQGQMAEEFDRIHSIERAKMVGSIDNIIEVGQLRSYIVSTIERKMREEPRALTTKDQDP